VRNRARIIAVAKETFASHGLSVPIDEIARLAGVGPGTVHRHFPTKEQLFEAILLADLENLAAAAASLTTVDDPGRALFDFVRLMVDKGLANRALADALAGVGHDLKARIATTSQEMNDALGVLLVRAQEVGTVRPDVTPAQLRAMLAGIHRASELCPGDRELVVRMTSVICDGLRRPSSSSPSD
jgi:AcrR family transcriptional regulator